MGAALVAAAWVVAAEEEEADLGVVVVAMVVEVVVATAEVPVDQSGEPRRQGLHWGRSRCSLACLLAWTGSHPR